MTMARYYVYALVDPRKPEAYRYIGCTKNLQARLSGHIRTAEKAPWDSPRKAAWIMALDRAGIKPSIITLQEVRGSRPRAAKHERQWIDFALQQGHPLLNTDPITNHRPAYQPRVVYEQMRLFE